jgi:hypothetical protein
MEECMKLNRGLLAGLGALFIATGDASAKADDSVVIYRETFNIPDTTAGDPTGLSGSAVAAALGWKAFRNGGSYTGLTKFARTGAARGSW